MKTKSRAIPASEGLDTNGTKEQVIRPLAKKICVILKDLLKFRSNFELLG